tara:strand:+ start:170 stop:586 length:417 start_codon:yes stop_codon:yes gene_type:complete
MSTRILLVAIFLFLLSGLMADNEVEIYPNLSQEESSRFSNLTQDLRCPKCQSSSLAGSNSPISLDLKQVIYNLIIAKKTDSEIKDYLKNRYGEYISYDPPLTYSTIILWFGPFIFFCIVIFIVVFLIKKEQSLKKLAD